MSLNDPCIRCVKSNFKRMSMISTIVFFTYLLSAMTPMIAMGKTAGVSDLLGGWTCGEVKKAALNAPQKLFSMWAEEKILGDGSGIADQITKNGNIKRLLSRLGNIMEAMTLLDAAIEGSPKEVSEIMANVIIGEAFKAIGTGVPGAVWTLAKSLGAFAAALNEEMLDSNLETFSHFAERDPKLLGPGNVEYFLNNFLKMDESTGLLSNLRKKRTAFYEYARLKLGHKEFPDMDEWRDKENWNMVRSTAKSLLNDVKDILEYRRDFNQIKGKLKEQLIQLEREVAVLEDFQYLVSQVQAMTCQDDNEDSCQSAIKEINTVIESAIYDASDMTKFDEGMANRIELEIDGLNSELDQKFTNLTESKVKIDQYCTGKKENLKAIKKIFDRIKRIRSDSAREELKAKRYMKLVCAARNQKEAQKYSFSTDPAVNNITKLTNTIKLLYTILSQAKIPKEISFSDQEEQLSTMHKTLQELFNTARKIQVEKQAVVSKILEGEKLTRSLAQQCSDNNIAVNVLINQKLAEFNAITNQLPDAQAYADTVISLMKKIKLVKTRISKLKKRQKDGRKCLKKTIDLQKMENELNEIGRQVKKHFDQTLRYADKGDECKSGVVKKCGTNEYRANNGMCDCKPGYPRNAAGKCVSPFDQQHDDATDIHAQRRNQRNQNNAQRVMTDQESTIRDGYNSDSLAEDLDETMGSMTAECNANKPCPDPENQKCEDGKCVDKDYDNVNDGDDDSPPSPGKPPGDDPECSTSNPCTKKGYECKNNKCVKITSTDPAPTYCPGHTIRCLYSGETMVFKNSGLENDDPVDGKCDICGGYWNSGKLSNVIAADKLGWTCTEIK